MIKKFQLIAILVCLAVCSFFGQIPSTIIFPNPQPNPSGLSADSYTRAATSISLQHGFIYGSVTDGENKMLNLNISSQPSFVNSGYLGSAINPQTMGCQNLAPPSTSNPVGETTGNFAVSLSGAATYNIPIFVSPGTNGIQPNLSLDYSNQSGIGLLGTQWDLSGLSFIERVPQTVIQDGASKGIQLTSMDAFSIDGNRLFALSGTYGDNNTTYYTENESFAKITSFCTTCYQPEKFEVKDKDGMTYQYGYTSDSKLTGISDNRNLKWYLNKVTDEFGNYMEYTYNNQNGEILINRIKYTGNSSANLSPYNEISFEYIPLAEKSSYYINAVEFRKTQLLKSITCMAGTDLVKRYVLDYQWDNGTYLVSVKEDDSNSNELLPTVFCWDNPNEYNGQQNIQTTQLFTNPNDFVGLKTIAADLNGDGFSDYLCFNEGTGQMRVMKNDFIANIGVTNDITFSQVTSVNQLDPLSVVLSSIVRDVNKDGRDEVYSMISGTADYVIHVSPSGSDLYKATSYYIMKTEMDAQNTVTTNTITGWATNNLFTSNLYFEQFYYDIKDYTGDGLDDIVHIDAEGIYLSSGSNVYSFSPPSPNDSYTRPCNFNNDGKTDFINIELTSGNSLTVRTYTFDGSSISLAYSTVLSFPLMGTQIPGQPGNFFGALLLRITELGDYNGDGLTDIAYLKEDGSGLYIRSGTGNGFLPPIQIANFSALPIYQDMYLNASDIDMDGKTDLTVTHLDYSFITPNATNYHTSYYSIGNDFIPGLSYSSKGRLSLADVILPDILYPVDTKSTIVQTQSIIKTADLNGDGITDLTSFDPNGINETIISNYNCRNKKFILQVVTPLRKKLEIRYLNLNSEVFFVGNNPEEIYANKSGSSYTLPLYRMKPNLYAVNNVKEFSAFNGQIYSEKKYVYCDAVYHRDGRGFLGFEQVMNFDRFSMIGNLVKNTFDTQFFVPLTTETTAGKFTSATTANSIRRYTFSSSAPINKTLSTFSVLARHSKGYVIEVASRTNKDYLKSIQSTSSFVYDLNSDGNISSKSTTSGWSGNPTVKTVSTLYSYVLNNGYYKPETETITQTQTGEAAYVRSIDYEYDTQGHLEKIISDKSIPGLSGHVLTAENTQFNAFGLPTKVEISASDIPVRTSEVLYEPTGRFIIKKTDALNNFTEYEYDPKLGNITKEKSITGLITSYNYDGLGRLKNTTLPNGAQNKMTYTWEEPSSYPYSTVRMGVYSIKKEIQGQAYSKAYYASNGEVLREETEDATGQTIIKDTKFNSSQGPYPAGVVLETTEPHYMSQQKFQLQRYTYETGFFRMDTQETFTVSSGNPLLASTTGIKSISTYNSLSTDNTYNEGFVTVMDHNSNGISTVNNAGGQVLYVKNIYPALQQKTTYAYASCGEPKSITLTSPSNSGQNIVHSFSYNDLGQNIQKVDPSLGTETFIYSTLGELLQENNATGNYLYTYDILGRLDSKTGSTSGASTYQYVTSGNGKGKLQKITGQLSTGEFKYDNFDRLIENKETILSGNKILKSNYVYDNYGREIQHTYPSGIVTKNEYNSRGYLTKITDANELMLWQLTTQDALGRIREFSYGNGVSTKKTYDDLNYLTEIDHGNGSIHKQVYTYYPLTGNMKSRTFYNYKTSITLQDQFDFDNLDRLKKSYQYISSTNTSLDINNLTYDILGNITHKDDAGDYQYTNTNEPFSLSLINPATSNIDPNNLNVQYNDLRKASQITQMTSTSTKQLDIVYGTSNQRIKTTYNIGGTYGYTRYYGENYDRQETAGGYKEWTYINSPSGLCGIYFNNNGSIKFDYVVSDHLGSPILLTNGAQIEEEYSFDSWGRRRNPSDWTYNNLPVSTKMIRGYTFHEHLDEFSLINMNGRVYDPVVGRFIQADQYLQDPSLLQNFNRYAYCLNNPLKYTDPTGFNFDNDDEWNETETENEDYYLDETGQVTYNPDVHNQNDLNALGIKGDYLGEQGHWLDKDGYLITGGSGGIMTRSYYPLPEVAIYSDGRQSSNGNNTTLGYGLTAVAGESAFGISISAAQVLGMTSIVAMPLVMYGDEPKNNRELSDNVYYHYTNSANLGGIVARKTIFPNSQNKVYITPAKLAPVDVFQNIFLSQTTHKGKEYFVVAFRIRKVDEASLFFDKSSPFELYHNGPLRLRQILFAGPNLFKNN